MAREYGHSRFFLPANTWQRNFIHMRRGLSSTVFALTVAVTCGALIASMASATAAYKPLSLKLPTQLPLATQGKVYTYSFVRIVSGGTGRPYSWKVSGALPSALKFKNNTGILSGKISTKANLGTYPLKVCVTGVKKTGIAASTNTLCKSTKLVVVKPKSTPKSTPTTSPTTSGTTFLLTIKKAGTGKGVITANYGPLNCGTICEERVPAAITMILIATTTKGSTFVGWSGGCTAPNLTCMLTVKGNTVVTARFDAVPQGIYKASINYPDLNKTGQTACGAAILPVTIDLYENKTGQILGVTDTALTLTWSLEADRITVNFDTRWGPRGPKVWKWNVDSLSGELPVFCVDTNLYRTLLSESFVTFGAERAVN